MTQGVPWDVLSSSVRRGHWARNTSYILHLKMLFQFTILKNIRGFLMGFDTPQTVFVLLTFQTKNFDFQQSFSHQSGVFMGWQGQLQWRAYPAPTRDFCTTSEIFQRPLALGHIFFMIKCTISKIHNSSIVVDFWLFIYIILPFTKLLSHIKQPLFIINLGLSITYFLLHYDYKLHLLNLPFGNFYCNMDIVDNHSLELLVYQTMCCLEQNCDCVD